MNQILITMKNRIKPLLALVDKANKLIDIAKEDGYTVQINCGGSLGFYAATNFAVLEKFEKDFLNGTSKIIDIKPINASLKKVTQELEKLENEQYCVEVTGRRPNGCDRLFVEQIMIGMRDTDF